MRGFALLLLLFGLTLTSCTPDDSVDSEYDSGYYVCDDGMILYSSPTTDTWSATLYRDKELIAGRQLAKAETPGLWTTNDMRIERSSDTIFLQFGGVMRTCLPSASETNKRAPSDSMYYATNTGDLISGVRQGESMEITLQRGDYTVFHGLLPRVVAGSGEKYEDGNTMFWSKGNTAMMIHDGVIYGHCIRMWTDEVTSDACPEAFVQEQITDVLQSLWAADLDLMTPEQRVFSYDMADLDGDDYNEILVAIPSNYFCGSGGCTWLLLASDFSIITKGSVSDFPFYISRDSTNGWPDLLVPSDGKYHVLKFDGTSYPGNPTVEPEVALLGMQEYTTVATPRLLELAYLRKCPF